MSGIRAEVEATVLAAIGPLGRTHAEPIAAEVAGGAGGAAGTAVSRVGAYVGAAPFAYELRPIAASAGSTSAFFVGVARDAARAAVSVVVSGDDAALAAQAIVRASIAVVVEAVGAHLHERVGAAAADGQLRPLLRHYAAPVVAFGALSPGVAETAADAQAALDPDTEARSALGRVGASLAELQPWASPVAAQGRRALASDPEKQGR